MTTEDEMRESFEWWCDTDTTRSRKWPDEYKDQDTQLRWEAWQAALVWIAKQTAPKDE